MPTTHKPDPAAIARELAGQNSPDSPVVQDLRRQVANAFVLYA